MTRLDENYGVRSRKGYDKKDENAKNFENDENEPILRSEC